MATVVQWPHSRLAESVCFEHGLEVVFESKSVAANLCVRPRSKILTQTIMSGGIHHQQAKYLTDFFVRFRKGKDTISKTQIQSKNFPVVVEIVDDTIALCPPCGQCLFRDRTRQTWADSTPLPHGSCNVQLEAVLH